MLAPRLSRLRREGNGPAADARPLEFRRKATKPRRQQQQFVDLVRRNLDRVADIVFVDTLALSREWTLAREALHPINLARMASPGAAVDFISSWVTHPMELAGAAWWAFTSDRNAEMKVVAASGIRAHVLWADRDGLLSRPDGKAFARKMGASFTVVHCPKLGPIDHDWMFRNPTLFVSAVTAVVGADMCEQRERTSREALRELQQELGRIGVEAPTRARCRAIAISGTTPEPPATSCTGPGTSSSQTK